MINIKKCDSNYNLDKDSLRKKNKKCNSNNENNNIINLNVNCCDSKENKTIESAFRATKATDQPTETSIKILYENEQFDLANEYNPTTSTFIPANDGVYNLIASVSFQPNDPNASYKILVTFLINGSLLEGYDTEFSGTTAGFPNFNVVETVDILNLNAGDTVEVIAISSVPGQYLSGNPTRFAASRVPSPKN
ncbi:hypothetical protein [Bacillus toyonensis]|uniref:hypothetical protein n=1 Tax=Bacillus toyonensis TaxID=155322 RepID=UPI0030199136